MEGDGNVKHFLAEMDRRELRFRGRILLILAPRKVLIQVVYGCLHEISVMQLAECTAPSTYSRCFSFCTSALD